MMRRRGALGRSGLAGSGIESAEQLPRIAADDLATGEAGERQRDGGLSGAGGPDEGEDFAVGGLGVASSGVADFGGRGFASRGVCPAHGPERPKRDPSSRRSSRTKLGRPWGSPCGSVVAKSLSTRWFISSTVS